MFCNPVLYEINTRIWLRRFDTSLKRATLQDVPEEYWYSLAKQGINYVWLMGIWQTTPSTINKYCFEPNLIEAYREALPDWKKEDVIGSPYAIDDYVINPQIGSEAELVALHKLLNKYNIGLVLDFVSNHFSADTSLLKNSSEIFLSAHFEHYKSEWNTFYHPQGTEEGLYFAHGRDPFFPAWKDTVQVNYFNPLACQYMISSLLKVSKYCDGIRCDMAMLSTNEVFERTWGGVLSSQGYNVPKTEFWMDAIHAVKAKFPDHLMIAEVYWDMEWKLQQLGFDFTYDKILTDRLETTNQFKIRGHLQAEDKYQAKSVHFLENHDETRSLKIFGIQKVKAAAIIAFTIQGMRFFYDGQFEGYMTHVPCQLGREPYEQINKEINKFYMRLLKIINQPIMHQGTWKLIEPLPTWGDSYKNIFAWEWSFEKQRRLVVVNYSDSTASCRLTIDVNNYPEHILFTDILNTALYPRSTEQVKTNGLFVQLEPFNSHIFAY